MTSFDATRLDDPEALAVLDPGGMLAAVAEAGAHLRQGQQVAADTVLDPVLVDGRPRAVVVVGMGGSGIAGDVLAAVCGTGCPVPVVVVRELALPGWVGSAGLVIAVSFSGRTEETLGMFADAARRGARVVAVAAPGSPLAEACEAAHGLHLPVELPGMAPRAALWALATPLLVLADALELAHVPGTQLTAAADRLDALALACAPPAPTLVNPAKTLALELADTLPMFWGTGAVGGVAAYRAVCQLAENAKYPGVHGTLPEVAHNQVVCLDGPWAASGDQGRRLRLVLLADDAEHPSLADRRRGIRALAAGREVGVSELATEPGGVVERLVGLVGLVDFASVYLAVGYGTDPTPIRPIDELKATS